jgi:peptide/nickel transport system ATP-binding protein
MAHLDITALRMFYKKQNSLIRAVDGINIHVEKGESVGIVGESGCGKSSLALTIFRNLPANVGLFSGSIKLGGEELTQIERENFRKNYRWKKMAMIPQSSMNALDPIYPVGKQMVETYLEHEDAPEREAREKTLELLREVNLPDTVFGSYPFQLSGGQKQRAMIAMSLLLDPELLIADEPTTALDVVVQAKILKLLKKQKESRGMTSLFISHDMGVVSSVAQRIAVMYGGQIVEIADAKSVFSDPLHPYTQKLIGCIPRLGKKGSGELQFIPGSPPALNEELKNCRFWPRCPFAMEICKQKPPALVEAKSGHFVACFLHSMESLPAEGDTS